MSFEQIQIGVCQIPNSIEVEGNFTQIFKSLTHFQKSNVDLILFPECALSGFSSKMKECSFSVLSPYLEKIQDWVNKTGIEVVLPTALAQDGKVYNSGFWFKRDGRELFFKVGLTESEKGFFSVPDGKMKKVFEIKNFKLALLICLEAQLEPWKYFQKNEADAILWPGYWGWRLEDKWEGSPVHSNMNQWKIPLIQANFSMNDLADHRASGPEGLSHVINPDNLICFKAPHLESAGFIVELRKSSAGQIAIYPAE